MTPAFWYSPTRRSKKLVLPCIEMRSIQSNGLATPYSGSQPSSLSSRSATNSMYCAMSRAFMPMRSTGSASHTNARSMSTASRTSAWTVACGSGRSSIEYNRQAKSQCRPSSRLMSSFEKVRPGMRPRFLSQKMAQNEPEKKMPSTHAKASRRCANGAFDEIHLSAHAALACTAGTCETAWKRRSRSVSSATYVSMSKLYVSEWMFSMAIWNP
mmetsp:Transcript_26167/g.66464  ORF Transcript_26167/g.66464 Transcript_26167/m.66464 type:complete len:213 (-) Transcript_26167:457-1095(-)